jgi:hypothetical protein
VDRWILGRSLTTIRAAAPYSQLHTHSTYVQFIEFPMKEWGNLGSFVYNLQIFACGGPYHGVEHTPDIAYVEGKWVGGSDPWFLIFAVSYLGGTKVRGPVSYFQSFLFSREYGIHRNNRDLKIPKFAFNFLHGNMSQFEHI